MKRKKFDLLGLVYALTPPDYLPRHSCPGFRVGNLAVALRGILSPLLARRRAKILDDDFFDVVLAVDEDDWERSR